MKKVIFSLSKLVIITVILASEQCIANQVTSSEEFIVVGNEPFWNVSVNKKEIIYKSADRKQQDFPYVAPLTAQGRPIDKVRVYRFKGEKNILILNKVGNCNDTMSEKIYPYSATLIMGNQVLEGCAERKYSK
jgi:uncharacterized membrane protein